MIHKSFAKPRALNVQRRTDLIKLTAVGITLSILFSTSAITAAEPANVLSVTPTFAFSPVTGIGYEPGICRRDPSDVIQVGDTWYVWYSRVSQSEELYPSGYNATVWYATSQDAGHSWLEEGEAIGRGRPGAFDSFGVFTPNILAHDGRFYLFYTAVAAGFDNRTYTDINRTAIGLAVADSPDGPWERRVGEPVLQSTRNPGKFDSFRVDDTCFVKREARFWMYYKGRQWMKTPSETQMGVAVADRPEGPYRRVNDGEPVVKGGHEVLVWPSAGGVMALITNHGPAGQTLQFAADGIHFRAVGKLPQRYPSAAGAFRPDMTDPAAAKQTITWGIDMGSKRGDPFLRRYEIHFSNAASTGRSS
jgi:hypothetical protein